MYLYALLVVYIAEHIVARYDMTTVREYERLYIVLAYDDGLLLVEVAAYHEKLLLVILLVVPEERYALEP